MSEWVDVPKAQLRLGEDGVAEIRHDAGVLYMRPLAEGHVASFRELLDARRSPLLVVGGDGFRPDAEAGDFLTRSPAPW